MEKEMKKYLVYEIKGQSKVVVCEERDGICTYIGTAICSNLDEFDFEIGKRIVDGRINKLKASKRKRDYPINRQFAKDQISFLVKHYRFETWIDYKAYKVNRII